MSKNLEAELYQLLNDLASLSTTNVNNNIQLAIDSGTLNITQAEVKKLHAVISSTLKLNIDISHIQIGKLISANTSSKNKKTKKS